MIYIYVATDVSLNPIYVYIHTVYTIFFFINTVKIA